MNESPIKLTGTRVVLMIWIAIVAFIGCLGLVNSRILPYSGKKSYTIVTQDTDSVCFSPVVQKVDSLAVPIQKQTKQFSSARLAFNQNPKLLIWMLLFAVLFTLSMCLIPFWTSIVISVQRKFRIPARVVVMNSISVLLIGILVVLTSGGMVSGKLLSAFAIIDEFDILLRDTTILIVFMRCTVIAVMIALCGMLMINSTIDVCSTDEALGKESFPFLKNALAALLSSVSAIIMLAIMTTSMIQQAIDGVLTIKGLVIFPSELVYLYGLMFTIFLAILYVPISLRLANLEKKLVPAGKDSPGNTLGKVSAVKSLQPILSIFAPLLGSIFSELITMIG